MRYISKKLLKKDKAGEGGEQGYTLYMYKYMLTFKISILNFIDSKLPSVRRWVTILCTTEKKNVCQF